MQSSSWQNIFVDKYLRDRPGIALLTTNPGEGKGTAALMVWERLWQDHHFENLIVITPSLALREHWEARVQHLTPRAGVAPVNFVVQNIQRFRGEAADELETLYQTGKTLAIIDEIHNFSNNPNLKGAFQPARQKDPAASQTLYLSGIGKEYESTLKRIYAGTEYIYDPGLLRQSLINLEIARLSPSHLLLDKIRKQGLQVDDISWRNFEKLVGELLESDGYTIELMDGTKDGGIDIVAFKKDPVTGFYKTVWQAKKFAKMKVGLHLIRELADSVHEFKASKGIIVTTSFLTKGALDRVERDKYTLGKVDRNDLEAWINRILHK